ncbi:MAG: efflux RND transporter periplasmic adaptor subunit [Paracoccaceae bacterium]
MRFLLKNIIGLALLGATLGLLLAAGFVLGSAFVERASDTDRPRPQRERTFTVNVTRATAEDVVPVLTAFGEIQSQRTLEIRAAVGGALIELAPEFIEGGRVAQGQVLARIDPSESQAALDRADADLLDARAEVREAARGLAIVRDELVAAQDQADLRQRALTRQRDLLRRRSGTVAAVEEAELAVSSAQAAVLARRQAVAQAEARVDQAETRLARMNIALSEAQRRLADTEIRAGFAGTLTGVAVVQGRLVSLNERMAQLVDADALEVSFRVSTSQYGRLLDTRGILREAPVTVTLDVFGTNLVATGTLTRESGAVGEGQTGRELFAQLDSAAGLKPGDFVTVAVDEPALPGVVRLPAGAINAAQEVLIVDDDTRLQSLQVSLLRRQGDTVLVRGPGLEGQLVVSERTPLLGRGIKVTVVQTDATDKDATGRDPIGNDAQGGSVSGRQPDTPQTIALDDDRRAALIAFVVGNARMPEDAKARILGQLQQPAVPAAMVARLESRMGG